MKLRELSEPIAAVVHLASQHPHVFHQVTLDPAKVARHNGSPVILIRLGDFPGDEANGWVALESIEILHVLGRVTHDTEKKQITITPYALD